MKLVPFVVRFAVATLPLALTPLLLLLLAGDALSLGGGEKDIVLVIPWILWSLTFLANSLVGWRKGYSITRTTARSAVAATLMLFALAAILAVLGVLGV